MRKRRGLAVDGVVAALLAGLVLAAAGAAHTSSTYYVKKWKVGEREQNFGFGDNFPAGNFRDRVDNGAAVWNPLTGNMQFHRGGVNVTWQYDSACNTAGSNSIHWGSIDGATPSGGSSTLAVTKVCVYNSDTSKIALFRTKYDSAENWYTGTGTPGGSQFDVWSTSAHEFGHATGFGQGSAPDHFPSSDNACSGSPKNTLCPSAPSGSTYRRDLEEHDKHTFNGAY